MIDNLVVHHLWFTVEAVTPISLPAECGPAIRGALVNALRQHYCPDSTLRPRGERIERDAGHRAICPVCWLIAQEDEEGERGRNVPRPYTIEPPLGQPWRLGIGERLGFGVSLIGQAVNLFPYLVLAIPEMGRTGLGHVDPRQGGRGRFLLRAISAVNPLSGARQPLLDGGTYLHLPALAVDSPQISLHADKLAERLAEAGNTLEIHYRTPTRIVAESHLVRGAHFLPLFLRLLERVEGLARYYAEPEQGGAIDGRAGLVAQAAEVELVDDRTEWIELVSGSRRLGRATPVSGYRGRAVYRARDWRPLLPWLLWGQSLHVGKSAVKGDGWFTIDGCPGWPDGDPA